MRFLCAVLSLGVLAGTARGQERPPGAPPDRRQEWNFNGANLQAITEKVREYTKKTFLWSSDVPLVQKTVFFKCDVPLDDPELLFRVYQHMLEVNQFALVPMGEKGKEIYKIVQTPIAMKKALPLERATGELSDRFVTRLFTLKYIGAQEVHAALINLASQPQGILPILSAGIIMVTDYDYNIARFEEIIKAMDVEKPDVVLRTVRLRNAIATELQQTLDSLLQALLARNAPGGMPVMPGQRGQQEQVKITADKRTNQIVVLAEPQRMTQILELIARLDSETEFETSGIYFLHLRHTNAVDVSTTLNAMYGVSVNEKGMPTGSGGARPGQPTTPTGQPGTPPPPGGTPPAGGGSQTQTATAPTIVADARSNAIIVVTDRNTFKTISEIVQRLDKRKSQVLLKASVVEISNSSDFDFGVELARLVNPEDRIVGIGRQQFGQSTIIPDPVNNVFNISPSDTPGITLAVLKDKIGNIGALVKAFEGKADIVVSDAPEVATIDNGYAEMKVKTSVPLAQTTVTNGISQTTFNKFEEAETTLSISPHITEGGYLRLETKVKIEKFTGTRTDPTVPPPKSTRELTTKDIQVQDGRTVVIGGIETEDENENVRATPFLADIPILGFLFRRETTNSVHRRLYIFITPYVIMDESFGDYAKLTAERKDNLEVMRGKPVEGLHPEEPQEPGSRTFFQFPRNADVRREDDPGR